MMAEEFPPALKAEVDALAVEMVTAFRAGLGDQAHFIGLQEDFRLLVDKHPEHETVITGLLFGQLAGIAAHALTQWDAAVPGAPATRLLSAYGQRTAARRACHGA